MQTSLQVECRLIGFDSVKRIGVGDLFSVGEYEEAFAFAELFAGFVPQDCDDSVVVQHVVQAKPLPGVVGTVA